MESQQQIVVQSVFDTEVIERFFYHSGISLGIIETLSVTTKTTEEISNV